MVAVTTVGRRQQVPRLFLAVDVDDDPRLVHVVLATKVRMGQKM